MYKLFKETSGITYNFIKRYENMSLGHIFRVDFHETPKTDFLRSIEKEKLTVYCLSDFVKYCSMWELSLPLFLFLWITYVHISDIREKWPYIRGYTLHSSHQYDKCDVLMLILATIFFVLTDLFFIFTTLFL